MADVKLVDKQDVPPKWEPFVVVTLSKAEAWLLHRILGSACRLPNALGYPDGLWDKLDSFLPEAAESVGVGAFNIPDGVIAEYKEMGGA